jgi:ATP-dependent Clp protease adaptor protein ClpS
MAEKTSRTAEARCPRPTWEQIMPDIQRTFAAVRLAANMNSPGVSESGGAAAAPPANTTTAAPASSGTRTKAAPRTAPPKVDQLPPWRVILHNDDVNDIGYVVETIIELVRVNPRQALLCTLTAHRTGLCLLLCTHRERAELLQDQFKSKRLKVTIEAEG